MMIVTEPATSSPARTGPVLPVPKAVGDNRIQQVLSIVVVTACWIFSGPFGFSGRDGLVLALLAVNSLLLLGRHLPNEWVPRRVEFPLLCCWAAVAASLLCLRSNGAAPAFAYFVAGQAGYRLRFRPALTVALLAAVLSTLGLWLAELRDLDSWPAVVGLTVALPVFIGMANRSRDLVVASALDAARSAQRAAESEARERTLAERARISRDIHDVLAHSLSGVSMQLELSEMLLDAGDSVKARDAIEKAHSMVREGMTEARRAVTALRAETLPLARTLQAQFSGSGDVTVVGAPRKLPVEAAQTLIRAAQEALTNARRHAVGSRLDVVLEYGEAEVVLRIDNDPAVKASSDTSGTAGSGMGLVGMRERAALLGGRVEAGPIVDGRLAGGWRVTITVPTPSWPDHAS